MEAGLLKRSQVRPPSVETLLPPTVPDSPTTTSRPREKEASSPRWVRSPAPVQVRPSRVRAVGVDPVVGRLEVAADGHAVVTVTEGEAEDAGGVAGRDGGVPAVQERPPSVERKTREAAPPLPKNARWPEITRQSPLAEKLNSPVESGMPASDSTDQERP